MCFVLLQAVSMLEEAQEMPNPYRRKWFLFPWRGADNAKAEHDSSKIFDNVIRFCLGM
jgi:hypothetical protein